MWQTKTFTTQAEMDRFLARNGDRIQWQTVYVNNAFGIIYRALRIIG